MTPAATQILRAANLARLAALGIKPAPRLPVLREAITGLRPARDVATRLMALDALFTWVSETEEAVSSKRIRAYAARNRLVRAMTRDERAIFQLDRATANARHVATIGWRLENMWPLAWALGFRRPPAVDGAPIPTPVVHAILLRFLPGLEKTVDDLLARAHPRSERAVASCEDLFYCAHNAARSARRRAATGVIHERRHALTWCMAPRVAWDDVDLST